MKRALPVAALFLSACTAPIHPDTSFVDPILGIPFSQQTIVRVNSMPRIPEGYKMTDWRKKALDYDAYVFDWNRSGPVGPIIWLDTSRKNVDQDCFGLYTAVGDVRQGPSHPSAHEGINTIAAVLSGGLMGIDKTNQDGYNYPRMLQNYFAVDNGWGIMLNGTSGFATDWWYNLLPNILYYGVCDLFPEVEGARAIQRSIADRFSQADDALGDNYGYSFFNYGTMKGFVNGIPVQQDAAGGHAYVLLCAYRLFGDSFYLERAKHAASVLDSQTESRFYEILMPFGIYAAACLNAMEGTRFDLSKMLEWTFDGSRGRPGWGVLLGRWGDYAVDGLQGSITDGGGYAFQMNSYEMAWPLVPMVKYAPQYARMIGRWMLNNAYSSRLFFPDEIDDAHQSCAEIKDLTHGIIGYEGLRRTDRYGILSGSPVAQGDGPTWAGSNPPSTMFSLYSTSPVGIFGSIIAPTDVDGILSLDCNATDFYADRAYPVHLLYNPFKETKTVSYIPEGRADLFDIVACDYIARDVSGSTSLDISADTAILVIELPSGTELKEHNGHIVADRQHVIVW